MPRDRAALPLTGARKPEARISAVAVVVKGHVRKVGSTSSIWTNLTRKVNFDEYSGVRFSRIAGTCAVSECPESSQFESSNPAGVRDGERFRGDRGQGAPWEAGGAPEGSGSAFAVCRGDSPADLWFYRGHPVIRGLGQKTEDAVTSGLRTWARRFLLNLTSRQIGLQELLTSRLIRFWTVVNHGGGAEPTRRVLYRTPRTTLKEVLIEVLGDVSDEALREWSISVSPSPRHAAGPLTDKHLRQTLCDVGIVFGSVLTLGVLRPQPERRDLIGRSIAAGG